MSGELGQLQDIVQKWILWRNPELRTGYFSISEDDLLLQYFNCINFTGVKRIEAVLIENMFTDAVSAFMEYGGEYFDLIG